MIPSNPTPPAAARRAAALWFAATIVAITVSLRAVSGPDAGPWPRGTALAFTSLLLLTASVGAALLIRHRADVFPGSDLEPAFALSAGAKTSRRLLIAASVVPGVVAAWLIAPGWGERGWILLEAGLAAAVLSLLPERAASDSVERRMAARRATRPFQLASAPDRGAADDAPSVSLSDLESVAATAEEPSPRTLSAPRLGVFAPDGESQDGLPAEPRGMAGAEPSEPAEEVAGDVLLRITRRREPDGAESLAGIVGLEFAAGQKTAVCHVPVSPPFDEPPEIECEAVEGDESVRVKTAFAAPYGFRIEGRRGAAERAERVDVGFHAVGRREDAVDKAPPTPLESRIDGARR